MWNIDLLDYSDTAEGRKMRHLMFSALPAIAKSTSTSSQLLTKRAVRKTSHAARYFAEYFVGLL